MMGNNHSGIIQTAWIILILSIPVRTSSQNIPDCDLKFIEHLVKTGCYKEALYLLDSGDCAPFQMNDSIIYLRGWSLYLLNQPVASSESLIKIEPSSVYYLKSHFYASYNYTQAANFDKAEESLNKMDIRSDSMISLKNYQLAGIKLIQGNLPEFEEWLNEVDHNRYWMSDPYKNLLNLSTEMKSHKSKSPFAAGLMSGIIPGSGKLYAGKKGEAVTAFLSTAGLGLVTWENYRKSGISSFKTILFGSAFAVTYIANIYGAVFSVRILEKEYNENVKSTILFNLRIPLDRIFGK
jgi:hypothetical protein